MAWTAFPLRFTASDIGKSTLPNPSISQFYSNVLETLSTLPAVESAAASSNPLLDTPGDMLFPVNPALDSGNARTDRIAAAPSFVCRGYFSTMNIPILQGRDFAASDTRSNVQVVIITRDLASKLWPQQNPIGQQFQSKFFCK